MLGYQSLLKINAKGDDGHIENERRVKVKIESVWGTNGLKTDDGPIGVFEHPKFIWENHIQRWF